MNIVCIFLIALISLQIDKQNNITSMPSEIFIRAYIQWFIHHPEATSGKKLLKMDMPALDLYSPSGESLYYGTDSSENAAFLNSLSKEIPTRKSNAIRPSLKEAIEMLPEFKMREAELLSDKRYTVFAVTYPNSEECKQQNEAVAKLLTSKGQSNIRVLEVRLTNEK
jgi:hypothetical protein